MGSWTPTIVTFCLLSFAALTIAAGDEHEKLLLPPLSLSLSQQQPMPCFCFPDSDGESNALFSQKISVLVSQHHQCFFLIFFLPETPSAALSLSLALVLVLRSSSSSEQ